MEQCQGKSCPKEESTIASFGEGYATRSDEEGFGGIYGENQQLTKKDEEKLFMQMSLNLILAKEVK